MKKIFCLISIILASCDVSVNKQNSSNDIETAKKVSADFYRLVKEKKFTEAAKYFDRTIGYEDGLKILENVNDHIGDLDTVLYVNGTSNTTVGSKKNQAEFELNFKAIYKKMSANEEIVIELINDSLKITGYHPRVTIPPSN